MMPSPCYNYVYTGLQVFEADCELLIFVDQVLKTIVRLNYECDKKEFWYEQSLKRESGR